MCIRDRPIFLKTYPNPTTSFIQIESPNHSIDQLTLTNIIGAEVLVQQNFPANGQIDISHFEKGVYILTFQINNQTFTQKILKN